MNNVIKYFTITFAFRTFRGPGDLPGDLVSAVSGYSSFPSKEVSKQIKLKQVAIFDFLSLFVRKSFAHAPVKKAFTIGSLSNDDGDGNENCKKGIGLDWQTTNLHVHITLLGTFLSRLCMTRT